MAIDGNVGHRIYWIIRSSNDIIGIYRHIVTAPAGQASTHRGGATGLEWFRGAAV